MEPGIDHPTATPASALPSPAQLQAALPADAATIRHVAAGRAAVRAVLRREDPRLLVIAGPCSIHDPDAARAYAGRLQALAGEVADTLLVVMRVYFEKPRTALGWKGLINDPDLDGSCRIEHGLVVARQLLLDIAGSGLPIATEALDPMTPAYLHDLVSWSAIGARTTESQVHRELASALPCPVGFKNGTDGNPAAAVHAMRSAARPHRHLGIDADGRIAVHQTTGNPDVHVVLRGGADGPNHDADSVRRCAALIAEAGFAPTLIVDCSHDNSGRDPGRQAGVAAAVAAQVLAGNPALRGIMLESNLEPGNQPLGAGRDGLRPGVSVTDACIGWSETAGLLRTLRATLQPLTRNRADRVRQSAVA